MKKARLFFPEKKDDSLVSGLPDTSVMGSFKVKEK
jgi:hypothetical protein